MKITEAMKETLQVMGHGGAMVYLTTCSRHGKPNTVGERFVAVYRDEYIVMADFFAQKTRVNLNENPVAVVTPAHPVRQRTWSFSGPATVLQEGLPADARWQDVEVADVLSEWGNWAEKEPPSEVSPDMQPPALVQRGVIIVKIENITDFHPESAGQRIL